MCTHHHQRNPFACIIPPYMIDKIIEKENHTSLILQKNLLNLSLDQEIRHRRNTFSSLSNDFRSALAKTQLDMGTTDGFSSIEGSATTTAGLRREVYTAENTFSLPGVLLREEGQLPTGDTDIDHVFDYAGSTYNFFHSLFGRDSIDNKGIKLVQTVHYGTNYNNAFWDGKQMIYGEGDQQIFSSFTSDIDIVAHELTHGVIQYECNLDYQGESGALNESLADVFGIMIKQQSLNQDVKQSNWLIGEDTLIGNYAIRSLKAPGTAYINHPVLGTDPQVSHMSNYVNGTYDNGGVHLNSGIPNHAFYLAAYHVGGYAWERVGKVWYNVMCNSVVVSSHATFSIFKEATINEATKLFGPSSNVVQEIRNAWNAVGV